MNRNVLRSSLFCLLRRLPVVLMIPVCSALFITVYAQEQPAAVPAQPPASATDPAQAAAPAPAQAVGGGAIQDALANVSTKYKLREAYSIKDGEPLPGEIGQTRNAFKETLSMTVNNPKGEPVTSERVRQVIYTERPAAIVGSNRVTAVVRRFEALRFEPAPQGLDLKKEKTLEGLVIYVFKGAAGEQVMSLVPGRSMTEFEHQNATTIPTLLNFSDLLPQINIRIGDSWPISRNVARLLLGRGQVQTTKLVGTLEGVKPSATDPSQYNATVGIAGQVITDLGTCSINLKYLFSFAATNAKEESIVVFGQREPETVVTATGAISKLSFGQMEISDVPGTDGKIKQVFDRKLVYERQVNGRQEPLAIPSAVPKPTFENSWLVFEDPLGRFKLMHPPIFKSQMGDENSVLFASESEEFIRLDLDASDVKPETFRKELEDEWEKEKFQVFAVNEGALNEPAWRNREVYRIEAALQATDTGSKQRGHFDAYIMQFPEVKSAYMAETMTYSEQSTTFRDMVEQILQSIEVKAVANPPAAKPATVPE